MKYAIFHTVTRSLTNNTFSHDEALSKQSLKFLAKIHKIIVQISTGSDRQLELEDNFIVKRKFNIIKRRRIDAR